MAIHGGVATGSGALGALSSGRRLGWDGVGPVRGRLNGGVAAAGWPPANPGLDSSEARIRVSPDHGIGPVRASSTSSSDGREPTRGRTSSDRRTLVPSGSDCGEPAAGRPPAYGRGALAELFGRGRVEGRGNLRLMHLAITPPGGG